MKAFRIVAALTVFMGLALQLYVSLTSAGPDSTGLRLGNFFSYFTVLTNILATLAFALPALAPQSKPGRFFAAPAVRTAIVLYSTVTFATYVVILQGLWSPKGLHWVADTTLHYVMPALFLLDWLVLTAKGTLKWRAVLPWLAFPLLYGVYSIVRGPLTGFYPYPFLDLGQHGLATVGVNMLVMAAGFLVVGLIFIAVDRAMGARRASPSAP